MAAMSADTAPAAMPGADDVARLLFAFATCSDLSKGPAALDENAHSFARAILALFAPKAGKPLTLADDAASSEIKVQLQLAAEAALTNSTISQSECDRQIEAALAAERGRIASVLQAQADALWERCETKRTDPPSIDEQADAAQAFALQKAAAAIRAQGE